MLRDVINRALRSLSDRARSGYTGDVIRGHQLWSGADRKWTKIVRGDA